MKNHGILLLSNEVNVKVDKENYLILSAVGINILCFVNE
ncbi:hypothetical protein XNC3_740006 [Xenorhabdus nematophila F1]|nr:hypothetical protein XNC3_740006 [Xenorhabdus nematophila F1]CEE90083.1 hypothetical protein XNA1_1150014 [Xenorhabdus nematophila str. Anatoliense]CEF31894.1 hypothetical protein XNW1_4140012 [Xenorhabdus nematophila str. Websteri]CEK23465.1 hypothetical protein XNC2_2471 [Xenorhabdus nematophila AN6/1]CEE94411.1 hypothetical protein XNA1_4630014 [Xenorhabdus nematophila str. Anatoliense]